MDCADITFVVLEEHIRDHAIDREIKTYYPDAKIVALPEVTEGAAITALRGAESLPDDEPLLFNDCDHLFLCKPFNEFCKAGDFANGPDGALLTFASDSPAYSYLQYGADGRVCHTVEKQVVSHDAICGAYYFKNKQLYASACAEYLHHCDYKEFFVSGIYNVLADRGAFLNQYFSLQNKAYVAKFIEINQNITILQDYSAGSNATTMLCTDGAATFYRKYAFGADGAKLAEQLAWLRRNAARLPLCEILREGTGEGYCWYDMTYSGSAVGLFRYIHSNPPGKSAAILRSVLRALDEQLYRPTARPADPEKIEEYLNKKMDANLEKIRDARILKELWNYDRIWINGRSYRNLKELGRLFDHNALRTLFAADPVADIHGDLTVENIICRTDVENPDKAWYIIDPNTGNLHDSPYLDYGKLLQSLHGGYEFMMMTPRCTVQENHIDFQLTRSAAYDTLFEAVCDDLRARCGAAGLHSILAHELIHWLRLMPYKLNKDKMRAPMFYAGLVMVANDLNTWENEGKFDEKARTDRR